MGLVHYGHLDIGALLSCGRKFLSLQQQFGRMLMMVIAVMMMKQMAKDDEVGHN